MSPYEWVRDGDVMQQVSEAPSCTFLLSAMGAVVVALAGAVVKLATLAWNERMGRLTDRNETITQLRVMNNAAKEKGE